MKTYIKLGFMEDSEIWCTTWCQCLGIGASSEDAAIMAAINQYFFRDTMEAA